MPHNEERRQRTLSDADIEALSSAIIAKRVEEHVCIVDLTIEEGVLLKRLLKKIDTFSALVGRAVVTFLVVGTLLLIGVGFWSTLAEKMKP